MKSYLSPTAPILMMEWTKKLFPRYIGITFFIFTVLLFASCTKDDVTPNSNNTGGQTQTDRVTQRSTIDITGYIPLVPPDAVIFISHGGCLGTCPAYSVSVMPNGDVIYKGVAYVATV